MADRTVDLDLAASWESLFRLGAVGDLPDARLLDLFLAGEGPAAEAAFGALVARHGRMVDLTCRQVLGSPDDAEDACQATFLILARRAGSIRRPGALAGWLHEVAVRVATRARSASARRAHHERRAGACRSPSDRDAAARSGSWPELHEEIARLPAHHREPVVLCYLEGLSVEAAAGRLGCPRGTVLSRLARARERLKVRLVRRGISPVDLTLLPPYFASPGLLRGATRAALRLGPASPGAGLLLKGMLMTMGLERCGRIGVMLLACGASAGLVAVAGRTAAQERPSAGPGAGLAAQVAPPARVESKRELTPGGQAESLAYAPDGKGIATRAANDRVAILDPASGSERVVVRGQPGRIHAIAFAPDGATIAGVGEGDLVQLWDAATGELRRTIPAGGDPSAGIDSITAVAFAPDGTTMALVGRAWKQAVNPAETPAPYSIRVVDVRSGRTVWSHLGRDAVAIGVTFAPDGLALASSGVSAVRLWDARTGTPGLVLNAEPNGAQHLAFAPDGNTLAAGGWFIAEDRRMIGRVTLWDPHTGVRLRTLAAPDRTSALAFAPDGRTLAAGGSGPVRRYATAGGGEGHMLVSSTMLWDVATGERLWTSVGAFNTVTALAFAPDGGALVRADGETVALLDPKTGQVIRILQDIPRRL